MSEPHIPKLRKRVKYDEPLTLPGDFVKAPTELLLSTLSDRAVRLWLVLLAHCLNTSKCWPSAARLAKLLRVSGVWVSHLIAELEKEHFLIVQRRRGAGNQFVLCVNGQPIASESPIQPETEAPLDSQENPPRDGNGDHDNPKPVRRKRRPAPVACHDPEELRKILDSQDLTNAKALCEAEGVDLHAWWANLCDYVINGSSADPRPNPRDWNNWQSAIMRSARRAAREGWFATRQNNTCDIYAPYLDDSF